MHPKLKKIIFYLTFIAIGIYFAEVVSTNLPHALIIPFVYPAYGLLYVFFIDMLMRYSCYDFKVWYIFGALVGIITETYVAKVTFYGAEINGFQIFGVSPNAILFIILFYHAFFSFMIPAYFAKVSLKMPLPIKEKKWINYSFLLIPFLLIPIAIQKMAEIGFQNYIVFMGISGIIFILWTAILKKTGKIKNVLLTKKEKLALFMITIIIYLIYFFTGTNEAHGHAPLDVPISSLIVVSLLITLYLYLNFKAVKSSGTENNEIPYNPDSINFKIIFGWIAYYNIVIALLLLFSSKLLPATNILLIILIICGIIIAIYMLITSTIFLIRKIIRSD